MQAFVREVEAQAAREGETRGYEPQVGEPVRDPGADADGRFGWVLPVNGVEVRVLMPGASSDDVQGLGADAPALFVNGKPVWWPSAVMSAVPLPGR